MLHFCGRAPNYTDLKSQISDLRSLSESCSRQLRGWADSLQNSDIKGQRHLNNTTRQTYERVRRAAEFREKLRAICDGAPVDATLNLGPESKPQT